jgi:S-DNA-T family DNA segregation ATPase FtsK/SpoIIIE
VIASVFRQPMFALFAMVGAIASTATWVVGAVSARRKRRRANVEFRQQVEGFRSALRRACHERRERHLCRHRSVVGLLCDLEQSIGRIWERRVDDNGPLTASVGIGTSRWEVPLTASDRGSLLPELLVSVEECEQLAGVVAPLTLRAGDAVALHGDFSTGCALARSIIVQSAVASGPADWRLVVISTDPDRWNWTGWLPHARRGTGDQLIARADDTGAIQRLLESVGQADGGPVLVVVDDPAVLALRTGPLRRYLATASPVCLVIVPTDSTVPAVCQRVLTLGSTGGAHWAGEVPATDQATDIRIAGLDECTAEEAARTLSALIDPEDPDEGGASIPRSVQLADVFPDDQRAPAAIAHRWASNGLDPSPNAAIGLSSDGPVDIDLVRDGPHGLIAGTTGAGKSELLRTLVVSLAARLSPDHLTFVLVDYKGGSTFDVCSDLPHTVGVVTDLDDGLAERALVSLEAELIRRERLIRAVGASDLAEYRVAENVQTLPRLVVVIDEFAALAKELPDFLAALVGVAQRGRSLGIHLLLATQRPTGVVNDDIRANTNLRIALRLHDPADAKDVVGDELPASFPRGVPGRVALRLGPDELVVFQAAHCTGAVQDAAQQLRVQWPRSAVPGLSGFRLADVDERGRDTELTQFVAAISEAAVIRSKPAPHRPWLEALPTMLDQALIETDAIGLVDDPARQGRDGLRWDSAKGNLLLVGSLGSGTTSTLISLVAVHCRHAPPSVCHVYVIDAKGESVLDGLASIAHCAGVVRLHETERVWRLLGRLDGEIDRRSSGATSAPSILLFIDGLGSLRTKLGVIEHASTLTMLDRVLQDGPPLGVSACSTTDGSSSAALTSPSAHRWVFHVDDPSIARAAGIRGSLPPSDVPGRLRVVETMLEAQVAFGAAGLADLPHRSSSVGPHEIRVLADRIDPSDLSTVCRQAGGVWHLVVGVGSDDLADVALHVPVGDHVFIGGAALTGKSTALRQITDAWCQLHPSGDVLELRRSGSNPIRLNQMTRSGSDPIRVIQTLVVVDDAERVEDASGELAAILGGHRPGVTIVAAARLDAVRAGYGHWVRDVARSRCGLILTSAGEVDGDLLGITLPRRSPIPPRPGLAWLVDGRGHQLVQVADRMDE